MWILRPLAAGEFINFQVSAVTIWKLTQDYINEVENVSAYNYHPIPVVIKEGKGVWVKDVEGKEYTDQ